MSIGVSGGPEFEFAIHLKQSRFTSSSVNSSELPKSLAAGRPPPMLYSVENYWSGKAKKGCKRKEQSENSLKSYISIQKW